MSQSEDANVFHTAKMDQLGDEVVSAIENDLDAAHGAPVRDDDKHPAVTPADMRDGGGDEEDGKERFLDDDSDPLAGLVLESKKANNLLAAHRPKIAPKPDAPVGVVMQFEDEHGKPVDGAFYRLGRAGNDAFIELLTKGSREWGDAKGQLSFERLQWLLPHLYAQSLFLELVSGFRLGPPGETVDRVERVEVWLEDKAGHIVKRTRTIIFQVDDNGDLVDSEKNRRLLLMVFKTIQDQIFKKAEDPKNFPREDAGGVAKN